MLGGKPDSHPELHEFVSSLQPTHRPTKPTFGEVAERVIQREQGAWTGKRVEDQWRKQIASATFDGIRDKPVNRISRRQIIELLESMADTPAMMRRAHSRIRLIFQSAVARDDIKENPAEGIQGELPKSNGRVKHHPFVPHQRVAETLRAVEASDRITPVVKLALRFTALTASRGGEVRGMTWDDVDLDSATWSIPADKIKTGKAHRIPLAAQAMAVLEAVRGFDNGSGYVFPSPHSGKQQISDSTMLNAFRKLGTGASLHGFRSTWRVWAMEVEDVSWAVGEAALGHAIGSAVAQAYARSDLLERRRPVMERWADYVTRPPGGAAS